MATTKDQIVEDLRELIEALDRREPHRARSGEPEIARQATALRRAALRRIAELEASTLRPGASAGR